MIINSDNNSLLILQDNNLIIRNLNEYTLLKYQDFNGNRIILKIGNIEIIETFNEGIFNVIHKDISMQIRDKIELCKRIKLNDEKFIYELLLSEKSPEFNMEFLLKALNPFYNRLKFNNDLIIVDNLFCVDKNGQAYFIEKNENKKLCIVANNLKTLNYKTDLGDLQISFRTLEIIYKVLFLLHPNLKDNVFTRQLSEDILKIIGGKNESSK